MKNYVTVIAALTSFLITSLLGFIVIPYLRKLKFGQTILDIGPKWHKSKQGTPTMGGIMMIAGTVISFAAAYCTSALSQSKLYGEFHTADRAGIMAAGIIMPLCMGAIGFFDDYIKVVKKRNLGLTARQKTFLQMLVAALYLTALAFSGMHETYIPFVGSVDIMHGAGLLFWPVALMFIYGFTNSVNLTDGIDGLDASVTLVVACAFMLSAGYLDMAAPNALAASLAGACAGFIVWNAKPAKVFMGDTGSLFLGGMVVSLSFSIGRPILLIPMGIIYLIEALSVILQVAHYKRTKKRLFKMAPIHHHFEMCGMSEQKIVFLFSSITLIFCFLSILSVIYAW